MLCNTDVECQTAFGLSAPHNGDSTPVRNGDDIVDDVRVLFNVTQAIRRQQRQQEQRHAARIEIVDTDNVMSNTNTNNEAADIAKMSQLLQSEPQFAVFFKVVGDACARRESNGQACSEAELSRMQTALGDGVLTGVDPYIAETWLARMTWWASSGGAFCGFNRIAVFDHEVGQLRCVCRVNKRCEPDNHSTMDDVIGQSVLVALAVIELASVLQRLLSYWGPRLSTMIPRTLRLQSRQQQQQQQQTVDTLPPRQWLPRAEIVNGPPTSITSTPVSTTTVTTTTTTNTATASTLSPLPSGASFLPSSRDTLLPGASESHHVTTQGIGAVAMSSANFDTTGAGKQSRTMRGERPAHVGSALPMYQGNVVNPSPIGDFGGNSNAAATSSTSPIPPTSIPHSSSGMNRSNMVNNRSGNVMNGGVSSRRQPTTYHGSGGIERFVRGVGSNGGGSGASSSSVEVGTSPSPSRASATDIGRIDTSPLTFTGSTVMSGSGGVVTRNLPSPSVRHSALRTGGGGGGGAGSGIGSGLFSKDGE